MIESIKLTFNSLAGITHLDEVFTKKVKAAKVVSCTLPDESRETAAFPSGSGNEFRWT